MHTHETEVLVVGAGPVGLCTALAAVQAGLETVLIDREQRTAARSYACALHPRSLALLQRLGLLEPVLVAGRKVRTLAFYEDETRQGELDLSKSGGEFPFLLLLPQNALESLLQMRLEQAGCRVQWRHRLDSFAEQEDHVTATIEELTGTSTGYIIPHWETVVKNRVPLRAQLIVGADGHSSVVRQHLASEFRAAGPAACFAAFEFETSDPCPDEIRVVFAGETTNVLWPLPQNRYRWTFQLLEADFAFPEKERRAIHLERPEVDEKLRQYVQGVAAQRAPWFAAKLGQVTWCSDVAFERRLATPLGRRRVWLAGDAAHQTGPVGVQSMNAGLAEAEELVTLGRGVLRQEAPLGSLNQYDRRWQAEWQQLLGLTSSLKPRKGCPSWLAAHVGSLLPCLPGTGPAVPALAGLLGFELN